MDAEYDVLVRIDQKYEKMSKRQKTIAAFILNHYDQAVFMTAAQIGETLHISESTVVRFASALGYDGYPHFLKALEECVRGRLDALQKTNLKLHRATQSEVLESVLAADIEKIKDTMHNLDPAAFDAAVEDILHAETVYCMGLRSCEPLAEFLHFYLHQVRKNVVLIRSSDLSETFEQMMRINEKDCFIGISFPRYSLRTLKAMEFANDRNARVIAITDNVNSPMNLYSSCNLLARSDMFSIVDSLVAPLSVINALLVAVCMKCPQEVQQNMNTLSDIWTNYQVNLPDEIDRTEDDLWSRDRI